MTSSRRSLADAADGGERRAACFVAVAATRLTGYGSGVGGSRNGLLTFVMSLLIAAVTVLLIGVHRPTRGLGDGEPAEHDRFAR